MTPTPFTSPSRSQVALSAFVTLACIGLASCGGGPGTVHPDLVHPDLVVEGLKVNDRPAAAASFTFSATVRNAGDGNAAATSLRVYRSDDETITPSDEEVGAASVPALAASASAVVSVTAPSSPGSYYYGACVDPVAGESDTANGCSTAVPVTVPAAQDTTPESPRPDLVVESPSVSPDGQPARTSFTFSATVRNAGDGNAAATSLRVYRSDDETITPSDEPVGAAMVPALAALERHAASVDLSVPSSAGTSYYGACVQAVAEESDTENNCSAPAQVTVQAPQVEAQGVSAAPELPRPDLTLRGAWVDNANPARGGVFGLSAEVHNRGPTTRLDVTLRFYRSTDATIERSDTQLTTRRSVMGTSQYNEEVFVPVYVKAPSSNGVYYYGACVDEVVGESDTTNNCSAPATPIEVR